MTGRQLFNAKAEAQVIVRGTNYEFVNIGWRGSNYFMSFKSKDEKDNVHKLYDMIIKKSDCIGFQLSKVSLVNVDNYMPTDSDDETKSEIELLVPGSLDMTSDEVKSKLEELRGKVFIAEFFAPVDM